MRLLTRELPNNAIDTIPKEEIEWKELPNAFKRNDRPNAGDTVDVLYRPADDAKTTIETATLLTDNKPFLMWLPNKYRWAIHPSEGAFRLVDPKGSAFSPRQGTDIPTGAFRTIAWPLTIRIPVHLRSTYPPSAVDTFMMPVPEYKVVNITTEHINKWAEDTKGLELQFFRKEAQKEFEGNALSIEDYATDRIAGGFLSFPPFPLPSFRAVLPCISLLSPQFPLETGAVCYA